MDHPRRNTLALALTGLAFATTGFAMSQKPQIRTISAECLITGDTGVPYAAQICPAFYGAIAALWDGAQVAPPRDDNTADMALTLNATAINQGLLAASVTWKRDGESTGETPELHISLSDAPLNAGVLQRGFMPLLRDIAKEN